MLQRDIQLFLSYLQGNAKARRELYRHYDESIEDVVEDTALMLKYTASKLRCELLAELLRRVAVSLEERKRVSRDEYLCIANMRYILLKLILGRADARDVADLLYLLSCVDNSRR